MFKFRTAMVSILALVLSVFIPLQTAPATAVDATFTKTFTVLGTDGNPYGGAQVALIAFDERNHQIALSTPATTNSNGVALVTVPLTSNYVGFSVQPPATDTTTALFTSRFNGISKGDEAITVNLVAANLRVKIVNSDGTDAPAGSIVSIPSAMVQNRMKTTVTVRSGATAVAVSTTLAAGNYEVAIGAKAGLGTPSRFFAMEVSGSGSEAVRTLHATDLVSSAVLAPNAGLYTLQLPVEQIRGTLKTYANASVTLPSSANARLTVTPYNDNGSLDGSHAGAESSLFNTDGTFTFSLPTTKPGRYNVEVLISGAADFPSFTGPDIWVDAAGNYSMTDGNYASADSFVYDLRLPQQAPNFVLELKNADGSAAPAGIYVSDTGNDYAWMGVGGAPSGLAAFALPNGNYVAHVEYFDSDEVAPFEEIQITVTNGVATVRNQQTPVPATSGVNWTFSSSVANLNLLIVNPTNTNSLLPGANLEIFTTGGNYVQNTWSNDGFGRLTVADGTYELKVNTPDDATYAQRSFELTVDGSSITVQDETNTAVPVSGGKFVVSPQLSNAIFRVVSPTNSSERVIQPNINLRVPNGEHLGGVGSYDTDLGFLIPEGVFEMSVNANSAGYAAKTYSVTRDGETITVTNGEGDVVTPVNGVYLVSPATPNVQFKVAQPGSQNEFLQSAWLDVIDFNTQQWVANGDMWSGVAGLSLANGKYTVRVNPGFGVAGLAENTYVLEMISGQPSLKTQAGVTVQANGEGIFIIEPKSANVILNIKHPTTEAALLYSHVQVFELDEVRNFRDWVTFGNAQDGTAGISLADGHYGVEVQAGGSGDSSLAQNRYELTVSGGVATELKTWGGVAVTAANDGSYVVYPKAANLLLKVVNPDAPTQILRGSYVNLRDNGNQWLPGGGVNNLGQVGLNVDDGTYTLEVNPGGQASGLASKTYNVVVSNSGANVVVSDGSAALVKDSATSVFTVTAASANVKLKVVDPADGTTVLEQANANIFRANGNQRGEWLAHSHGSNPGFALGNGSYIVEIQAQGAEDEFANEYYKVNVAGSVVTVTTLANVAVPSANNVFSVSPATANVSVTVINPTTNAPIYSSWVEVFERSNNRWITGIGSNRGNVSLNLPEGAYTVKVNPGGAGNLAAKSYDLDVNAGGVATVAGATVSEGRIQLAAAAANVLLKVVSPNNQSKLLPYAHVSVHDAADNRWISGSGGNTGNLALRLEDGTYNLQLDPGNVVDELLARKNYSLTVSNSGSTIAINNSANQAVSAVNGVFTLTAALPAITGIVQAPDADAQSGYVPVPNSWVEPFNTGTNEYMWQNSSGSNQEGRFGIAVPDGSYSVSAQVPWNSGYNLAKSAPCAVTVTAGAITTTAGGCVVEVNGQKSVQLNLRAPNVSFIVTDFGGTPLPNANVSMYFGGWHVWANANDEGRVSMFVDPAEIAAKNPGETGLVHLRASIEPPYGSTTSVRYECSNGVGALCSKLPQINLGNTSTPFAVLSAIGTVALQEPNTRVTVVGPDNASIGEGAWVTLFKDGQNGARDWIGGSNTGSNGQAVFNVTDQTGTFTIEVNAPHGKRGQFASKTYSGLTFAQLNGSSRALATPNLKLKVQQPAVSGTNKAAKWSWVNIERINEQFNPTGWVPGSSTDDLGLASSFLDADGNYRLTVYPGGGSAGARTICDVTVAAGVVSLIAGRCDAGAVSANGFTITLSRGNVTGLITAVDGISPLAGAIVVAESVDASSPTQQFTTGADGTYGFQLAQGDWNIKVYYVNEPDTNLAPDLVGTVKTVGQVDVVYNKNLEVAP